MPEMISDPIEFELFKNSLFSIADEMALTIFRTTYSGVLKDNMDYSTAMFDGSGKLAAQGLTLPGHLGSMPTAMAAIREAFDGKIAPGDVFILNDPFQGGMHLPDIFVFKPIFCGRGLLAWAGTVCHHTDVGGRVPGSNASDSTEIYQEGLRIPPLKLYDRGVLNTTLEALIKINVRVPDRVWGDLSAESAAAQAGKRGVEKLLQRYGADEVDAYMQELLDYAERLTRQEIKTWPKGTYRFVDHIDSDGFSDAPIPIKVAITVNGDGTLLVYYTGSSPQVKGALNSSLSFTHSLTYLSVRCVLAKDVPNNVGLFRCITVKAPEASVLNPVMPAPCAARALTGYRVFDTMLGALAQIVPDKVPAAGEGGNSVICISGLRPNRQPFIIVDMVCGAWGGRPDKDGLEAVTNASQNLSNMPVEVMEAEHPVRIEDYSFVPDSCGAGQFRGGVGVRRSYRILAPEALLQLRTDRVKFQPYGLSGGEPGGPSRNFIEIGNQRSALPGKITTTVAKDTLIIHEQAGAGGFGNPLLREPEQVREDFIDGKITAVFAERHYAVMFGPRGALDVEGTARLRSERVNAPELLGRRHGA